MANTTNYGESGVSLNVQKPKLDLPNANKAGLKTGLSNTLSLAKAGSMFGPIGTAVGAAAGITTGVIKARKMDKENHQLKLDASKDYMNNVAAANESFLEKSRMRSAAENGDFYTNKYENMKKGGDVGMHPTVAQTMGYINKNKKTIHSKQSGGPIEIKEEGKVTSMHRKNRGIRPGGSMDKNPNWVYRPLGEEGVGTLYRFEDGYHVADTDQISKKEQMDKLKENNFEDAFSSARREFIDAYVTDQRDDRFDIQENGDVILKDKNIYLGNVNSIQKLDYRQAPGEEGKFQIKSPRYINKNQKGGSINLLPEVAQTMAHIERMKAKKESIFRSGGSLNIIPKGVTHEEDNNIGDKGIPIVTGEVKKKIAEIEVNELTLNKKTTDKVESLIEEFKKTEDPMVLKELGKYIKLELDENTVDNQGELL